MQKIIYFEDLEEGSVHWGSECLVDEEEMLAYNRQNDPWPFHVDKAAAAKSPFGGLIASGGYIITLTYRLGRAIWNSPEHVWAFLGGFDWRIQFLLPVRPGDRLRYRVTISSKRLSSKPGRGIVQSLQELVNQHDQIVFTNEVGLLLATRPQDKA